MNILDTVKDLAATAIDKTTAAGQAAADAAQTVGGTALNAVEKLVGMDLNGDGTIGENAPDVATELPEDDKTV